MIFEQFSFFLDLFLFFPDINSQNFKEKWQSKYLEDSYCVEWSVFGRKPSFLLGHTMMDHFILVHLARKENTCCLTVGHAVPQQCRLLPVVI